MQEPKLEDNQSPATTEMAADIAAIIPNEDNQPEDFTAPNIMTDEVIPTESDNSRFQWVST